MNPPPPMGMMNQQQSDELKKYLLRQQGKGPLFAFLVSSATFFLIFLVTVLKPNRYYKKLLDCIFNINVKIGGYSYKTQHFLILIALFYASLYFFLLMQGRQNFPSKLDQYKVKMEKLDRKWVLEAQSWLSFLIVVCVLSIYKFTKIFMYEKELDDKIEEYKKSDKCKNKKNE